MEELQDLIKLKNRYINLQDNIQQTVKYWKKSINSLDDVDKSIGVYYTINDSRADNNKLSNLKSELTNRLQYVQGSILPEISNQLMIIRKKIENLGV